MTTSADQARDHVAATRAAIDQVEHLHATRPHDRAAIAASYDAVRQGLKLAEVQALLAIADELAKMNQPLTLVEAPNVCPCCGVNAPRIGSALCSACTDGVCGCGGE